MCALIQLNAVTYTKCEVCVVLHLCLFIVSLPAAPAHLN